MQDESYERVETVPFTVTVGQVESDPGDLTAGE